MLKLRPRTFRWREESGLDPAREHTGFVSQEVLGAVPEAVTGSEEGGYGLQSRALIAALVNAVQEQQEQIEELREELRKGKAKAK